MKAKWGMMIVDGRGKLGGHVLAKNRSGAYARTKVTPVNPQTTFQQNSRNRLATFSQAWRSLTAVEIAAWNAAVSSFAKSNVFGDIVNPTGKNLFTRLNINLANIGEAQIDVPPLPVGGGQVVAGAATVVAAGAKSVAHTEDSAGHTIQVWATAGVSPGKLFVKNQYRLIGTFVGGAASPAVVTAMYDARFGTPAVGTRVGFRLVSINDTTGESSVASETTAIAS